MNREQVAAFVAGLMQCQQYVPPIVFQAQVLGNPFCKVLEAIANGQIEFQPKPPEPPAPPPAAGKE